MRCTILLSLLLLFPASLVRVDSSGVSFTTDDSASYADYQAFVDSFGRDDYILLVIKNGLKVSDPLFRKRVDDVHHKLSAMPSIQKVIDLGTVAASNFTGFVDGAEFWTAKAFTRARLIIPGFNRLISSDMKNLAVIVKINNEKLNGFQLEKQLKRMKGILVQNFPEYPHCYATGTPVLRAAFERNNLQNALIFGSMGLLFGILIAFYLFKTPWAAVLVMISSLVSLFWVLGIMGVSGIDLNLATGLSFGFILVVSTTTAFHVLSTYFKLSTSMSQPKALQITLQTVTRPCFMCALTTSAGFLSLVLSSVPMVRQAGIIIPIGVLTAFFLTMLVNVFLLPILAKNNKLIPVTTSREDTLDLFIKKYLNVGFRKPLSCLCLGTAFAVIMLWAIPQIKAVKHLTAASIKSTREAKELAYIEQHLGTGTSFSVLLQSKDDYFLKRNFWYDLAAYEKRIKAVSGVNDIESITSLIFRMALRFSSGGIKPEKIFEMMQVENQNNEMLSAYYNPLSNKMRIIVHLQSQSSDQIETILKQVRKEAEALFAQKADVTLSGQLILLRSQTTDLVSSQVDMLIFALLVITILMMIQLKSIILGVVSLIPNLLPLITIFGIMGWFHIPLDPLTIFAGVISFGLSVDDSIHYLTQIKREMHLSAKRRSIYDCMKTAYHKNARALVSTTAVLLFSSMGLLFSSFSHVFSLGILVSSASVIALIGDLVFMPAVILEFKYFKTFLPHRLQKTLSW